MSERPKAPVVVRIAAGVMIASAAALAAQALGIAARSDDDLIALATAQVKVERDAERANMHGREFMYREGDGPQIMSDGEIDAALSLASNRSKILGQVHQTDDSAGAIPYKLGFAAVLVLCSVVVWARRRAFARVSSGIVGVVMLLATISAISSFQHQLPIYHYFKGSTWLPLIDWAVVIAIPAAAIACLVTMVGWRTVRARGVVAEDSVDADGATPMLRVGWAVAAAKRVGAPTIERTDQLQCHEPIEVVVSHDVSLVRDKLTLVTLPLHASTFAKELATREKFVAEEALAWEPRYQWVDVAAILGTLVQTSILGRG